MSKQIVKEYLEQRGFDIASIEISHYQISNQERIFALIELSNIEKNEEFFEKYHGREFTQQENTTLKFHLIPQFSNQFEERDKKKTNASSRNDQVNSNELFQLIPSKGELQQLNQLMLIGISPFLSSKELLYLLNNQILSAKANKVQLLKRENFLCENIGIVSFKTNKDAFEAKKILIRLDGNLRNILGLDYQGAILAEPSLCGIQFNPLIEKRCKCLRIKNLPITVSSEPLYNQVLERINSLIQISQKEQKRQLSDVEQQIQQLLKKLSKKKSNSAPKNNQQLHVTAIRIYQNRDAFIFFNQTLPKQLIENLEQEYDSKIQITQNQSILANQTSTIIKECEVDLAQKKLVNPKEYYSQPYNGNARLLNDGNKQIFLNAIIKKELCSGLSLRARAIIDRQNRKNQEKNQSSKYDERKKYKRERTSSEERDEYESNNNKRQKLVPPLLQPPPPQMVNQPQSQQSQGSQGMNQNQQMIPPQFSQLGMINPQQLMQQMANADPSQIQNLQMQVSSLLNILQQSQMYSQQNYQQQNNYRGY